jgi:MFS family permease
MGRARLPRALSPLRHRDFRLLVIGQVTSNAGDACYAVALPWYVLATHGGAVLLGTVLAAYGIPRTALIAFGGYASDRWRPQTVMLLTDVIRALVIGVLALTAALGPARARVLVPLALVIGAGEGLFLPASFSIVPALLAGDDLGPGNALASSGTQLATLIGPAVGGALVAIAGPSFAFAVDAATFAVSALTLYALRAPRAAPTEPAADASTPAPTLRTLLRTQRVLSIILLVNIAANLGSGGLDGVALPALAHGPLNAGATGYGVILAAFGGGALARLRRPRATHACAPAGASKSRELPKLTPQRPRRGVASSARGQRGLALARVEDSAGVQGASNSILHRQRARVEFPAHSVALEQADAVLTGDGAAELDRGVEEVLERGLGGDPGGVVAGRGHQQGMQVAVADVGDRRDGHAVPGADRLDPRQHRRHG